MLSVTLRLSKVVSLRTQTSLQDHLTLAWMCPCPECHSPYNGNATWELTCLFLWSRIREIWIFFLPIVGSCAEWQFCKRGQRQGVSRTRPTVPSLDPGPAHFKSMLC